MVKPESVCLYLLQEKSLDVLKADPEKLGKRPNFLLS